MSSENKYTVKHFAIEAAIDTAAICLLIATVTLGAIAIGCLS